MKNVITNFAALGPSFKLADWFMKTRRAEVVYCPENVSLITVGGDALVGLENVWPKRLQALPLLRCTLREHYVDKATKVCGTLVVTDDEGSFREC